MLTVPAAHAVISAGEDHSVALPLSSTPLPTTAGFSPVIPHAVPMAFALPVPRVSPEASDPSSVAGMPAEARSAGAVSATVWGAAGPAVAAGAAASAAAGQAGAVRMASGVIRQADAAGSIRRYLAGPVTGAAQPHKIAELLTPPVAPVPAVAPVSGVGGVRPAGLVMPPVPSKAGAALSAAMGAMGTPYRWGGTGRGGFDCSGLAQWAYRKAGITLPRSSRAQSGVGTPVTRADLRPGDLVFFYRPVSHVGIYVGNGNVVHAPESGDVVKISPISRMPFAGARRL